MDNQTLSNLNSPISAPTPPTNPVPVNIPPKKSNYGLIIGLTVLVLALMGGSVFAGTLIGKKQLPEKSNLANEIKAITPTNSVITPTATPSVDPFAGWKTVNNEIVGFRIKYPSDWTVVCNKDLQEDWISANICDFRAPNTIIEHGVLSSGAYVTVGAEKIHNTYSTLEEKVSFDEKNYGYKIESRTINGVKGYTYTSAYDDGNAGFLSFNGNTFITLNWIEKNVSAENKELIEKIISTFSLVP